MVPGGGTASLNKELIPVANPKAMDVGDVFIQGGFPGHAVLIVDLAENAKGDRVSCWSKVIWRPRRFTC